MLILKMSRGVDRRRNYWSGTRRGGSRRISAKLPELCGRYTPGFLFPLRCSLRRKSGGIVVAKTLAKLTFGIVTLAAATSFGSSTGRASGDAPWCAVINIGQGTVYWDCQYPTFEACYHLGNILAGNRGFCNL